jgi:hypothetical protein
VVLFVHLSADAVRSHDPDLPVTVEHPAAGTRLLTAGQVAAWCGRADTTTVTVKPVIDLNAHLASGSYAPSGRLAEQVRLRDRICVFPHCTRPARSADLDHIQPFDAGGPSASANLASLCRLHHRIKTHGGWTYTMVEPGVYLWRSPYGYSWVRDRTGTTDLTPPPVDPPPRRTS